MAAVLRVRLVIFVTLRAVVVQDACVPSWFLRVCVLVVAVASVAAGQRAPTPERRVRRAFPDTSSRIAILADQLPGPLTPAQQRFVAARFVGTQKLTLNLSRPLRALNPAFLVLHYHLAIWQSAPHVAFIVDGQQWGNDYPEVNRHEAWFWHNEKGQRVASVIDQKLLMNIGDPGFAKYWAESIAAQVRAGDYDAVFADSASPALLQAEAQPEPRFSRMGARDSKIAELQGRSYIDAWQPFIASLDASLAAEGVPLIPNTGAFVTTWDSDALRPHRGSVRRRLRRPWLRRSRLEGFHQPSPLACRDAQDHHPRELPAIDRRPRPPALLPRQLPARERRSHLPRVLRAIAARVVSRMGFGLRAGRSPRRERSPTSPLAASTGATSSAVSCW